MTNNPLSPLEHLRKLVVDHPVLQRQIQESPDLNLAMEAVRNFARQQSGAANLDQIAAGLSHVTQACHASNVIPDAQLEGFAGGADPLKFFLGIIAIGITYGIDKEVEAQRNHAEGYGE